MCEHRNSKTITTSSAHHKLSHQENNAEITLTETCVGFIQNNKTGATEPVKQYTWTNTNCMYVNVITYGATVLSIKIPNRNGLSEDVVLGFSNLEDYIKNNKYYFGATLGRTADITIDAQYQRRQDCDYIDLSINHDDGHHINGGLFGFSNVNWTPHMEGTNLILTYLSRDGEEGYPGNLMTQIRYSITSDNCFKISYSATCDQKTPINISNRIYFNLAGHAARHEAMFEHVFHINASKYVETLDELPTEKIKDVCETYYDFRIPSEVGAAILNRPNNNICDTFLIRKYDKETKLQPTFVCRVIHPESGRALELYSTHHCVQFSIATNFPDNDEILNYLRSEEEEEEEEEPQEEKYAIVNDKIGSTELINNVLNEMSDKIKEIKKDFEKENVSKYVARKLLSQICSKLKDLPVEEVEEEISEEEEDSEPKAIYGKDGAEYQKYCAFYFQSENFPNAANHRNKFPDIILKPGENYRQDIIYKFGLHMVKREESNLVESELVESESVESVVM